LPVLSGVSRASAVLLAEGETYWPRPRTVDPADLTRSGQRFTR
jgi:hypothetical protein